MKLKVIPLLIFLTISTILLPVYAQSSDGINAAVNKMNYQLGDKVIITGSVKQPVDDNPVTMIVRNPIGNVYTVGQEKLLNNVFVHDFVLNDNSQGGNYTVNIRYGDQSTQIYFTVSPGQVIIIPVLDDEIKVRTNDTNPIKYGDVSVSAIDDTIKITIDTSSMTTKSVSQEYKIPKRVIDHPGDKLIVKVDQMPTQCTQSETNTTRILDCIIQSDSKEMELTGTVVIPEFGPFAGLIICAALIITIILTRSARMHSREIYKR